jgi:hypothetical protein
LSRDVVGVYRLGRKGRAMPSQCPTAMMLVKVLRISEEPLIGRVSAAEYFQGAFGQKAV